MEKIKADKTLNVIGMRCPYPLLKTTREMSNLNIGETLQVIADDPMAPENIDSWAEKEGHAILRVERTGKEIKIYVKKKK